MAFDFLRGDAKVGRLPGIHPLDSPTVLEGKGVEIDRGAADDALGAVGGELDLEREPECRAAEGFPITANLDDRACNFTPNQLQLEPSAGEFDEQELIRRDLGH